MAEIKPVVPSWPARPAEKAIRERQPPTGKKRHKENSAQEKKPDETSHQIDEYA